MKIQKSNSENMPSVSGESNQYLEILNLFRNQIKLELWPVDLAVLLLLKSSQTTSKAGNLFFSNSQIRRLFKQIELLASETEESGVELRFTSCLQRLIKTNCLIRTNSYDLSIEDPEYMLTSIGDSISVFYSQEITLDASSIVTIFDVFNAELIRIREGAAKSDFHEDWQYEEQKIAVALSSLLKSIQQFQSSLDIKYANYQELIPELLTKKTDESIEQCEQVLEWIIKTIQELYEVTHSSANTANGIIEDIESIGRNSEECPDSLFYALNQIAGQIDGIVSWVSSRQLNWVNYHGFVHTFLRNVVRIDREKRITDALAKSISDTPDWTLLVTSCDRPLTIEATETPPKRERKKRLKPPKETPIVHDDEQDLLPILNSILNDELSNNGYANLSSVLKAAILQGLDVKEVGYSAPELLGEMVSSSAIDFSINDMTQVFGSAYVQELKVRRK